MFERFTSPARRVIVRSQEEARGLEHNFIGTEHILLGILSAEQETVATRVLGSHGLTLEVARQEVIGIVGRGKAKPSGHIPFTPRAKKTLELALRAALQLHHDFIGSEHILLGLIREGEGVGAQILRNHAWLDLIRAEVVEGLPAGTGIRVVGRSWLRRRSAGEQGDAGGPEEQSVLSATPAADATLSQAARLAGTQPVGSHHLLLAALSEANTAAARALGGLGVDLDRLRDALRTVDITGTADEQPEEAGRRQLTIRVTDQQVTLEATDPVIVAAGLEAVRALGDKAEPAATIPGALPESASLAAVWQALRESLGVIAARATEAAGTPGGTEAGEPDDPGSAGGA